MKFPRLLYQSLIGFIFLTLPSCGLISLGSSDESSSSDEEAEYEVEYDVEDQHGQSMYYCPMCQGNLQIQDIYTGRIIDCPACEGNGVVTEEVYRQLKEAEEIGRQAVEDYNQSTPYNNYKPSSDDIQMQINQCQIEIDNIDRMLQNLDEGSTSYIYYSQQRIQLQYKIKQLELQL